MLEEGKGGKRSVGLVLCAKVYVMYFTATWGFVAGLHRTMSGT